jgi:hypothetical protein
MKKSRRYMPYGDKEGRPSYKNIVPAPPKPAETIAVVAPVIAIAIPGDAAQTRSPKRKRDEDVDGAEFVERIGMSFVEELRTDGCRSEERIFSTTTVQFNQLSIWRCVSNFN